MAEAPHARVQWWLCKGSSNFLTCRSSPCRLQGAMMVVQGPFQLLTPSLHAWPPAWLPGVPRDTRRQKHDSSMKPTPQLVACPGRGSMQCTCECIESHSHWQLCSIWGWMAKNLAVFLAGQPRVPTSDAHAVLAQHCTARSLPLSSWTAL